MSFLRDIYETVMRPFALAQYQLFKGRYEVKELKDGVSAVVVAKNESYTLPIALESLIGFANEIICIDNDSSDDTLAKMQQFKNDFSTKAIIEVIEAPGKLLGDCRNMGLERSHFNWHLRWDADMVFRQHTGSYNSAKLKEEIMKIRKPVAVNLRRINLSGDFHHVPAFQDVVDGGELFLVRRTRNLSYKELIKYDVLNLPLFYSIKQLPEAIVFHLKALKSIDRILYRNEYFNWRKAIIDSGYKDKTNFETFRNNWRIKMYGTSEQGPVLYRFHKKFVRLNSKPYEEKKCGHYAELIQEAIDKGEERFSFIYKDGIPVERKDREDAFLDNYVPTKEDLEWDLQAHLVGLLGEQEMKRMGIY